MNEPVDTPAGVEVDAGATVHGSGRSISAEILHTVKRLEQRLETLAASQKEVLSVQELAAFLGLTEHAIYKMIKDRRIRFSKPNGKKVFFFRAAVMDFLHSGSVESETEMHDRVRRTPSRGKDLGGINKRTKAKKPKTYCGKRRLQP